MKNAPFASLLLAGCVAAQTPPSTSTQTESNKIKMDQKEVISEVQKIASESECITHRWKNRGLAPSSYIKGMGVVYARAFCNPNDTDVKMASAPVDLSRIKKMLWPPIKKNWIVQACKTTPQRIS